MPYQDLSTDFYSRVLFLYNDLHRYPRFALFWRLVINDFDIVHPSSNQVVLIVECHRLAVARSTGVLHLLPAIAPVKVWIIIQSFEGVTYPPIHEYLNPDRLSKEVQRHVPLPLLGGGGRIITGIAAPIRNVRRKRRPLLGGARCAPRADHRCRANCRDRDRPSTFGRWSDRSDLPIPEPRSPLA